MDALRTRLVSLGLTAEDYRQISTRAAEFVSWYESVLASTQIVPKQFVTAPLRIVAGQCVRCLAQVPGLPQERVERMTRATQRRMDREVLVGIKNSKRWAYRHGQVHRAMAKLHEPMSAIARFVKLASVAAEVAAAVNAKRCSSGIEGPSEELALPALNEREAKDYVPFSQIKKDHLDFHITDKQLSRFLKESRDIRKGNPIAKNGKVWKQRLLVHRDDFLNSKSQLRTWLSENRRS